MWPFGLSKNGYGRCHYEGTRHGVHKVAYLIARGAVPDGHEVMHTCDTPPCFNPYHLKTGTHLDNVMDMYAKDRGASILTKEQVREIRELWPSVSFNNIAAMYGVSTANIHLIINGKKWKNVPFGQAALEMLASDKRPTLLGIDAPSSKLTDDQVRSIRRIGSSMSQRALAKLYGLESKSTVGAILRGETWPHLLPE